MFACIKTSVVVALTVVAFQGDFSQISEFNLFFICMCVCLFSATEGCVPTGTIKSSYTGIGSKGNKNNNKGQYHCLVDDATVFSSTIENLKYENVEYGYCVSTAGECPLSSHTVPNFFPLFFN